MPIQKESVKAVSSGGTNTISIPITISSSAERALFVGTSIRNSGSQTVSTVTFTLDGAEESQFFTQIAAVSNGTTVRSEIWGLLAPDSGSGTVTITLSATCQAIGGAIEVSGVDQTGLPTTTATATGSSTSPSVTISSVTEHLVLDTVAIQELGTLGVPTVGSGQTEQWSLGTGILTTDVYGVGSTEPGASSVTMDWSLLVSRPWATVTIDIVASVSGFGLALIGVGR